MRIEVHQARTELDVSTERQMLSFCGRLCHCYVCCTGWCMNSGTNMLNID